MNAPSGVGSLHVIGTQRRTLEILVAEGKLHPDQAEIIKTQQRHLVGLGVRRAVGELAMDAGFVEREHVLNAISRTNAGVQGTTYQGLLPVDVCLQYRVMPSLLDEETGSLTLQSARRIDSEAMSQLLDHAQRHLHGHKISRVIEVAVPRERIERELASLRESVSHGLGPAIAALEKDPENGPLMTQTIRELFLTAAQIRASDVHVVWDDVNPELCWVAMRIDGELRHMYLLSPRIAAALTRRLKDSSDMDASESRRQQDGRNGFEYLNRKIDIRVAAQPLMAGERIVMRLLDPDSLKAMDELFPATPKVSGHLSSITGVRGKEGGFMIVAGATGQGKTTTLYAMIRALARHRLHVVTIEDPVEFKLPFTTQIQFNPVVHNSMADIMRGVMREDPDVIVVGEIRDSDTAMLALRAAESGHLVLTTLHTSDAYQVYERMLDLFPSNMSREAVLPLANNLRGALHQVLARRVCPRCSYPTDLPEGHVLREKFGLTETRTGKGCDFCENTGYRGRLAIPEAVFISSHETARTNVIRHLRDRKGTLRDLPAGNGVTVFRREDSVMDLLRAGEMDLVWAERILGLTFGSTQDG